MLGPTSRSTLKRSHRKINTAICGPSNVLVTRCHQLRYASFVQESRQNLSGLRHEPWSFTPDTSFRGTRIQSALARFNLMLAKLVDNGRVVDSLMLCKSMKEQGVNPDLFTYNYLLQVFADKGLHQEAWATFDDMKEMGISPDLTTFHHLIHAGRFLESNTVWDLLELMGSHGVKPTSTTFSYIIDRSIINDNLEMALQYMAELNARQLVPELKIAQSVILLAARKGQARLALDLAEAFEEMSIRRLDNEAWVNCLISSAECLYLEGVQRCWQVVVHDLHVVPDEGICIDVLHTAARHAVPELATEVIEVLSTMGATLKEHHFAPVIEAFCRADKLKDAINILELMRSSGIELASETGYPIFKALSGSIEALDSVWDILDEMHQDGTTIDVLALNVVIQASLKLDDLQRAIGTYRTFSDYGVKPDIDTFNMLLSGCVTAGHRELGDRMMGEMKEAKIKPNEQTYEQLILLCLTQTNYEDAFFYLEEMKAQKHIPSGGVYQAIIKTCASAGDTRSKLALTEMKECGHPIPRRMERLAMSGSDAPTSAEEIVASP